MYSCAANVIMFSYHLTSSFFNCTNFSGVNGDTLISWDHFFNSCQRYFENLRHDRQLQDFSNPFAAMHALAPSAVRDSGWCCESFVAESLLLVIRKYSINRHYILQS